MARQILCDQCGEGVPEGEGKHLHMSVRQASAYDGGMVPVRSDDELRGGDFCGYPCLRAWLEAQIDTLGVTNDGVAA